MHMCMHYIVLLHQVIIITGLNKLYTSLCSDPEDGLKCRQGVKLPLKLKLKSFHF